MREELIEMLACPVCQGPLGWEILSESGGQIETAEARCESCKAVYPVREGIGGFLTPDLARHDLWDEVESRLSEYLRAHPQVERQLLESPLEELAPADRFLRAMLLEERGSYAEAKAAAESAKPGLYTPEGLACHQSQIEYLLEVLEPSEEMVIDLASGQGQLIEAMARSLQAPLMATDFSPRVLRRDRKWFEFLGFGEQVSYLAFDARRMPFREGVVRTMTTNLGLSNIERPGELVQELRRVLSGTFLAICHFFPEDDDVNGAMIREWGLEPFLYRRSALECFAEAGFRVELANVRTAIARPTPKSELIEGAGIDALPAAETELEWCVLVAR